MLQTASLVVRQISVNNFVCSPMVWASDLKTDPIKIYLFKLVEARAFHVCHFAILDSIGSFLLPLYFSSAIENTLISRCQLFLSNPHINFIIVLICVFTSCGDSLLFRIHSLFIHPFEKRVVLCYAMASVRPSVNFFISI